MWSGRRNRRLPALWAIAACGAMLAGGTASAATIFYDGFEGGYGNFSTSGVSLKAFGSYWGVYCLEADNSDSAIRWQSTAGYANIEVSFYHKTSGYDIWPADTCYAEYTTNGGSSWTVLGSWTSNFDWTYRSYSLPSGANNNANFGFRIRAGTNSNGDDSWWDEVTISGTPTYTLSTNTSGSGSVGLSPSGGSYTSGTNVTVTANPATGWQFDSWTGDLSGGTNPESISMTANKSVTAVFTQIPVTLTINESGPGSVSPSPSGPYVYGQNVTLTATPDSGATFDSWSGDLSGTNNPESITLNGNKTVTGTFSYGTYTLSTSVSGDGSIDNTNPQTDYDHNETTVLKPIPDAGWRFVEWTGTIASTDDPLEITFTQSHTLTAVFEEIPEPEVVTGLRVLMIGDSWTDIMDEDDALERAFTRAGYDGVLEKGDNTAIGGTTASYWAQSTQLDVIESELVNNPTIDMVHLSMGGNDFLAGSGGGGWYKGMGGSNEDAFFAATKDNIEAVIQRILDVRPEAHIVICSYDWINLWDTLNVTANQLMWANLGSPSPRELNEGLMRLSAVQHELAVAYGQAVTYVNNYGLMHYAYGYNAVFGPARFGVPWGHPNYPVPKSALANGGDDPIHLDEDGYDLLADHCVVRFYYYLIDPLAGELPEDADDFPAPPPAYYDSIFYDGFEDGTGANWSLSGAGVVLGSLWGSWSLEVDNSDTAIRAQSTAGYENIRVRFNLKTDGLDAFPQDSIHFEYTVNGGSSWVSAETWTSNFDWSFREYVLPATADNNTLFGIRFRGGTNSNNDNAWVDEVNIEGTAIPCELRTLTTKTNGTGTVAVGTAPDYGLSYCDGTNVQLTATPADGWTFVGWEGDASGSTNPLTVSMTANKTVVAKFTDSEGRLGLSPDQWDWLRLTSFGLYGLTVSEASSQQRTDLLNKANEAETRIQTYHLPYGQAADMWWSDYSRTSVGSYETIGDGATWTGVYLAGLAAKYDVTGDSATLTEINEMLDTIEFLSTCTSKDGYIARFAGPANDPAYEVYYEAYGPGYGTCVSPWTDHVYLEHSTRDTYLGVAFGLGAVWIHVSDSATRARCQAITERILDTLIDDGFSVISPQSNFELYTPGFALTWQRLGISMNDSKYGSQYSYGQTFWLADATSFTIGDKWNDEDYFSDILGCHSLYVVRRLETNTDKINALNAKLLKVAESDGGDHLNPHFAAAYLAATGDTTRATPRGVLQGCLIDYESGVKWMKEVDQTGNPLYPPKNATHSLYAMFPHDRVQDTYLWQKEPTQYAGGFDGIPWEYNEIDRFTIYWMGRECGAIPAP